MKVNCNNMRNIIGFFAAVIVLASCNMNYEKSSAGIIYKVHEGSKKGEKLKIGTYFKFHLVFDMPEKDTSFVNTEGRIPSYGIIDSTLLGKYNFYDFLVGRSAGDRIEFVYSVDSLFKNSPGSSYNNVFGRRDMVHGRIAILQTFNSAEEMQKDLQKEEQLEKEREKKELKAYIAKKNIKAIETPLGAYIEVEKRGNGAKLDTGAVAYIFYTGKLFNGSVFDSNREPKFNHTDPLPVHIGSGVVIPGLDEGLRQFAKGGKGKIYIPSYLAYGQQGYPPVIQPFAPLIFDVEIYDVQLKSTKP